MLILLPELACRVQAWLSSQQLRLKSLSFLQEGLWMVGA